jgi:hypothetical protein
MRRMIALCENEHVPKIVVRRSLAGRALAALFTGGFGVFVVVTFALAAARGQDVSGAPIAFGMAVLAGALGYRLAALSFRASGQKLVIHNYLRTRHVPVSDVVRLDLGRISLHLGVPDEWDYMSPAVLQTVHVITTARVIPIDAMAVPNRGADDLTTPLPAERLERQRQELAAWLATARSLSPTTTRATTRSTG